MQEKSSFRPAWALSMALAMVVVALVASPAAQAHGGKSYKHWNGGKSGQWHKQHRDKNKSDVVSVVGGNTKLFVDAGTGAALGSLGIAVEPVDPARVTRRGAFRFPITGGEVNAKTLVGQIRHSGGLAFVQASSGTRVEVTDFNIDIDANPTLTAKVGDARVPLLSLDVTGLERKDRDGAVVLTGIKASLTAVAAGALNDAFETTAFTEGLLIGTARVKAYVQTYDRCRGDDDNDREHGYDDDRRHGGRDW
jgi:hypothetical protein